MTLQEAHAQGFKDALARYGVKEAAFRLPQLKPLWHPEAGLGTQVVRSLIGHPDIIMKEGLQPFRRGGPLSLGRMFWPDKTMHPLPRWLTRASTALSLLPVVNAVRGNGDPNEGRLSNVLSTVGSTLGTVYGGSALGMLGAPLGGALGAGAGKMLGHLFGSRPTPPPVNQYESPYPAQAPYPAPYPAYYEGGYY